MRFIIYFFIVFLIGSCQFDQIRSVKIDNDTRAEGRIGVDNVYNGVIKFYNIPTNKLIEEANYSRGIQEGNDIFYHANGAIAAKRAFTNGVLNGYTFSYDSVGHLLKQDYYYYNLRSGGSMEYLHNKLKYYRFFSLEKDILFYLDYDSLKGRKLPEIQPGYFFYRQTKYTTVDENDSLADRIEYFLYTPNPPKFNFQYSLVTIDSNRKVLSVLKDFSNTKPWSVFNRDKEHENINRKIALRLTITDSINNLKIGMLKGLNE
jgi:hypothetical protein